MDLTVFQKYSNRQLSAIMEQHVMNLDDAEDMAVCLVLCQLRELTRKKSVCKCSPNLVRSMPLQVSSECKTKNTKKLHATLIFKVFLVAYRQREKCLC